MDLGEILGAIHLVEYRQPGLETLAIDQDFSPAGDEARIEPVPNPIALAVGVANEDSFQKRKSSWIRISFFRTDASV